MRHPPAEHPHIVVHSPALDGSRRVTEGDETLGVATHADDVGEILRLADLYVTDVEGSDLIEWQGGGRTTGRDCRNTTRGRERVGTPGDVGRLRKPQIQL